MPTTDISAASPGGESAGNSTPKIIPLNWSNADVQLGGSGLDVALIVAAVRFLFGKAGGLTAAVFNPAACMQTKLIKKAGNGSVGNYYRPDDDPRWEIVAVQRTLKPVALAPMVTMESHPRGFIVPFLKDWNGSAQVMEIITDPAARGFYYGYQGSDEAIGGYFAKRIKLDTKWIALYPHIKWPTPQEIEAAIPSVSFERMAAEDFKYRVLAGELDE